MNREEQEHIDLTKEPIRWAKQQPFNAGALLGIAAMVIGMVILGATA